MQLKPVARQSLSDAVFEQLSAEIVHGRLTPGTSLPSERALCDMLAVNRGAVREALKRLVQAGLCATHHGGGTRVLNFRRTSSLDLLSQLLLRPDGSVEVGVARSVMEMRAAMAPDIARLCALRAGPTIRGGIARTVDQMSKKTGDIPALQTLALVFWDELVTGSDNIAYRLAFNTLRETYEQLRGLLVEVMADEVSDLEAYRAIAAAVERGDGPGAARLAAALMERGSRAVAGLLAILEGGGAA